MSLDRRRFVKLTGLGVGSALVTGPRAAWPDERAMARAASSDSFVLLRKEQAKRRHTLPAAADAHRLPLSWYHAKARALKAEARERGVDGGILLTQRWNIIYATGLFHSTTERPFACFLPMDQDDGLIWLHPYLDQQLVQDWWKTGAHSYFDYHHAAGGIPPEETVTQGASVNIYRWWGETLAKTGYGDKTIGIDSGSAAELGLLPGQDDVRRLNMFGSIDTPTKHRPTSGKFGTMANAMPQAQFVDVYDIMVRHRVVKDETENRLTQRAMDYFSELHAFVRNYLLERGLGTLDWEVENAARLWGMHRIMQDIPQEGEPHNAVGIEVNVGCRTGRKTAYPHPNQVSWARIERGHALQFAGVVRVGGYGGEQYRSFLIAPWTDWQQHVWETHTSSYYIQAEQSHAGNTCSNVAKAVHEYQVANRCAHLIYHRPGHGEGMEGHQPPYQALGDYTVLKAGMHFSSEPGLYDPENGFGFNHSNNILVAQETGLQMGTAPCNKEWCLLEL
ncbi:MAG: M24 family metallopeptidase [Gemmatimonadales bacterium]|nr:M24 family metallopeptidase [Gemmatimonadales bacterium]NIN10257.1 M24 family metallopeptidase [Gemmatimonadales bacterium]NIN49053.1 M24 family metallopeptidase [Gemmatimonadales bacterium]NIP06517.1 M24 family metallopeptidase [Gemmatimonadales bacterium]NIQ98860.1 M24 family metallopeptidase [Gemmatimonadales bacterium]